MSSDALYREAMDLPADERATLAVRLLATVDEPAVDDLVESYTAWLRDVEQRLDALVSGEDPGEDWDGVYRDLVAEYRVEDGSEAGECVGNLVDRQFAVEAERHGVPGHGSERARGV